MTSNENPAALAGFSIRSLRAAHKINSSCGPACGPDQKSALSGALQNLIKCLICLAPRAGFEPATNRLTAASNTLTLHNIPVQRVTFLGHISCKTYALAYRGFSRGHMVLQPSSGPHVAQGG